MATQVNQKVYVSPGVYTSETDLSFVAQSVGVTTLGLVGETIKGPAFEPIFITNYDEFQAYFGGTEPTKFVNTQIPKYEAAYIAKSYLQQSNQLFVTRILGLSGYDAGPSWSIKVKANVDPTTIQSNLTEQYRMFDGSTSNIQADIIGFINDIIANNSVSGNTGNIYGTLPEGDFYAFLAQYPNLNNVYDTNSMNVAANDLTDSDNDAWYYANFDNYSGDNYSGYSMDYVVTAIASGASSTYTGTLSGNVYNWSGTAFTDYNNMVVATLRSRGISLFENSSTSNAHGPIYEVNSGGTVAGLSALTMVCSGQYSGVTKNPYETFLLSGVTKDNDSFRFR
jgi:hypothetical protein